MTDATSGVPCYEPVECPHECGEAVMPIVDQDGTARCPVCRGDVLANPAEVRA